MIAESLPTLAAILGASLLGSAHCAGMCGAFALIAVSNDLSKPTGSMRVMQTAAYNVGRLTTYVLFGALAGVAGAALDLGGSMVGLQRSALVLAGCTLLLIAVVRIARALGVSLPVRHSPRWMVTVSTWAHRQVFGLPPMLRAFGVGMLTTLLPCGWLYTFVIVAAATASPVHGSLIMATFWVGTVPMLALIGIGARSLLARLSPKASLVASLVLLTAAMLALYERALIRLPHFPPQKVNTALLAAPACHAPMTLPHATELRGAP